MANVHQVVRAAFGGAAASITAEKIGEGVEKAFRDMDPEAIKDPKGVIQVVVAILAIIPQPIRTTALHTIAAVIQHHEKVPGIARVVVHAALVSMDTGLIALVEENAINKGALASKLMDLIRRDNPEGGATAPATHGVHKPDACGRTMRDGGNIAHKIGFAGCAVANAGPTKFDESDTEWNMLSRAGIQPCSKCYPGTQIVVAVGAPAPAPKPADTLAAVLIADHTAGGSVGDALAVFEELMQTRSAELIDEPRESWHLALMHRKGLPKTPKAVALLPKLTAGEVMNARAAIASLRQGLDDSPVTIITEGLWPWLMRMVFGGPAPMPPTPVAPAPGTVVSGKFQAMKDDGVTADGEKDAKAYLTAVIVPRYRPYIAEIRVIAEQDVNDISEWVAKAVDSLDDRITSKQRQWLVSVLTSRTPWIILLAVIGLYLLAIAGSAAMGVLGWILTFGFTAVVFGGGAIFFLIGFIGILAGGGWPFLVSMYVGWAGVVVSRLFMPLLDRVYQLVRNALRGAIPAYSEGWFTQIVRKGGDFARSKGWLPAATPSEPVKLTTSSWWLDTALVVSIAACVLGVLGSIAHFAYHPGFGTAVSTMVMIVTMLTLQAADVYKRLRALLPWAEKEKDAIATKNTAISLVKGGGFLLGFTAVAMVCTGICTGAINSVVGEKNVDRAGEASRMTWQSVADSWYQEACESAAMCEPEHYPNETWAGYCKEYPNASDCQIRRRNGLNP